MKTLPVSCVHVAAKLIRVTNVTEVLCTFLLASGKESIGGQLREEVWSETEGFHGQRLEGPIPGKTNSHPAEKGGVPWMGKIRNGSNSCPNRKIPWGGGGGEWGMEVQCQMPGPRQQRSQQVNMAKGGLASLKWTMRAGARSNAIDS